MENDVYATWTGVGRTITDNSNNSIFTWDSWYPTDKKELRPDKKELRPEKIIFHDRTTIVIWNDGSKTKATCSENDIFDEQIGLASCLLKKMYGKKVHGKKLFDRMLASAERHNVSKTHDDTRVNDIVENIRSFSEEIEKLTRR